MATTYLSGVALEQLARAQAVIDEYIVSCTICGTNRPCGERQQAEAVFARYGRLPRRRPRLTRPGSNAQPAEHEHFSFFGNAQATPDQAASTPRSEMP
jgi:hypothetical protein